MKNLKKLSKDDLKKVKGGYGDMCNMGNNDSCAQYGLECGLYMGHDHSVGNWYALRCM
ncbi:bacteriocin-like protein [Chryseobacterium vrystaatense]|nr:hypothetical protein [Chryseobacterium vrystaatense]